MSEETQVTQETSTNSEVTPAQETTVSTEGKTQETQNNQPKMVTIEIPENFEYDGNRKNVPKPFENYAKSFDRYVSKKDQVLSDYQKKIQEYESKLSEYQKNNQKNTGKVEPQKPFVTQDEVDAIALGDAKTLEAVIERKAKALLEANVNPKLEEFSKTQESMALQKRELEAAETIQAFSKINPDFTELLESPVGQFMVDAASRGMNIEDIYKSAKAAETFFTDRADKQRKADLDNKRNGSVVGKSVPGTSNVVYADDETHAKRLAIELTLKGDNRQVQIKKK